MPDNLDPNSIQLAIALTAGGAAIFAGVIFGFIEILKRVAAGFVNGKEQGIALVLSAVVIIAAVAQRVQVGAMTLGIDTIFFGFLAWYVLARAAMAIHDDITRSATPLGGPTTDGPAG